MKTKIYFIPGLMCDNRLWTELFNNFDDSYDLVALEIPNENSINKMILVLKDKIKEENINLVGFSLGGYLASCLAIKYKSLVSRLFLIGSSPSNLKTQEIIKRKKVLEFVESHAFNSLSRQKVVSLLSIDNKNNEHLINLIQTMYKSLGKNIFINQLKATLNRENLVNKLDLLKIKKTIYYSLQDQMIDTPFLKKLEEEATDIEFIKISGTSHMVPLENPKNLCFEIKRWLE